jgi:hypothetical protein
MNGKGTSVSVSPGETINLSLSYAIRNGDDCTLCRQQIEIGVDANPLFCVYDGVPPTCPLSASGSASGAFAAPTADGTYGLYAANPWTSNCDLGKSLYPTLPKRQIGRIIVGSTAPDDAPP